jgi:NDP-sugar pyrophosphorylase family protein
VFDVIVNVHHFADQIMNIIQTSGGWGSRVSISDETGEILETGGGLKKAAGFFTGEEPFVLMNADILTKLDLGEMIQQHRLRKPLVTLAITNRKSSRYFLFDENNILCGWQHAGTGETKLVRAAYPLHPFAFSGIHIIQPAIFPSIKREGKFSMVDVYLDLCGQYEIHGFNHSDALVMDVGKPGAAEEAEKYFR